MTAVDLRNGVVDGDVTMSLQAGGMGDGRGRSIHSIPHITHSLTAEGFDTSEDGTGRGTPLVVTPLAVRGRAGGAQIEAGEVGGPYNTLRAGDGGSSRQSLIGINETVRRLTPLECERLQGFPDDWTKPQADGPRYRQMGNAVAVPVVEWIMRRLVTIDARANASEEVA